MDDMISYKRRLPEVVGSEFESVRHRFEDLEKSRAFPLIHEYARFGEKKVLDVGCSYGEFLIHAGSGSVGVSVSAKEETVAKSLNLDVTIGDIQDPDVIDVLKSKGPFQIIFANNIFEHLESPHTFLRSLTVLADEGTQLILGVPVFPKIYRLMSFPKFRGALSAGHINFFNRDTLVETVERAGWKVGFARPFVFKNGRLDSMVSSFMPHQYVFASKVKNFTYPAKRHHEVRDRLDKLYFEA